MKAANMSTTGIIDRIKALPLQERKAVLRTLSEDLEEDFDTRLFNERSKEPDGQTLVEVVASLKQKP